MEAKKTLEAHIDEYVQAQIATYAMDNAIESEFEYFLSYFFDQWKADEVDVEFILKVGAGLHRYKADCIQQIDQYTETFKYEQMDIIDQACLLLGILEHRLMQTPKEVVINEMVELAKRYSDDGAPKLINGILHPLLHNLDV
ncbi:MAG: transcription antitermination factor NusB [bacterium]|nr:transcription antitermination factor NusB [bacterium]